MVLIHHVDDVLRDVAGIVVTDTSKHPIRLTVDGPVVRFGIGYNLGRIGSNVLYAMHFVTIEVR